MMKKVFETKNEEEIKDLNTYLNDKFYECEIHKTSQAFELFVDENIYDEVLIDIEGMSEKPFLQTEKDKKSKDFQFQHKKGEFLYYVEKYYCSTYLKLLAFSNIFSFVILLLYIFPVPSNLTKNNTDYLISLVGAFFINLMISQIILIDTRYYKIFKGIRELFTIKIGKKSDFSSFYEILNFILVFLGHIFIFGLNLFIIF